MKITFFLLAPLLFFASANASANCFDQTRSAEDNYVSCKRAAEQGDSMAQYFVGQMYRKGDGTEKNPEQAVIWYRKAADQANVPALYNLGWMYDLGEGVPRNLNEAILWYEKAARQGDKYAPFNIGTMHYDGRDLPKNIEEALFWFDVAMLNGNEKGRKWRDKIAKHFSPEQLDQANARLQAWKMEGSGLKKN